MRRKMKSNRQGAVLMTVTVVSVMMVVIVAAAISLVAHTNTKTNQEYRKKQAYFAASSCLEAFVVKETNMAVGGAYSQAFIDQKIKELQDIATSNETAIVKIGELNGAGDDVDDGKLIGNNHARWNDIEVKLKVETVGTIPGSTSSNVTNIRAISTATYLDQTQKVVAYMSIKPLKAGTTVPGALEIIGTNGGGNASYNNICVYGNTSAPLKDGTASNTFYHADANDSTFYGDTSVYGSLIFNNAQPALKYNPYYIEGLDNGQTKGCTMYVSRSFIMGNNQPSLTSQYAKTWKDNYPPTGVNAFNYVQVDDALVMAGKGRIGSEGHDVDVYTHLLSIGSNPKNVILHGSGSRTLLDAMVTGCAEEAEYRAKADVGGASDQLIYGNVYVRKFDSDFDGSVYLDGLNCKIYGNLYIEGDLYCSQQTDVYGSIYFQDDGTGRTADQRMHGSVKPNVHIAKDPATNTDIPNSGEVKILDWTSSGGRATVPNNFNPLPYYYYPEHMLCLPGSVSSPVSTISKTYANFYEADKKTLKGPTEVPYFSSKSNGWLDSFSAFSGTEKTVDSYENANDISPAFKFTATITKSCVIGPDLNGTGDGINLLVDLDNAEENLDGGHDIVLILMNGAKYDNQIRIIVKNDTSKIETDEARFCYVVTDSGVGTVFDEYSTDKNKISTYSKGSDGFNGFNGNAFPEVNMGNATFTLCDYDTFFSMKLGKGLNPTDRVYTSGVYNLPHNDIIVLLTEGSTFKIGQNTSFIQACIYGPRANVHLHNGTSVAIYPEHDEVGGKQTMSVEVVGNVITSDFITNANNDTIVYNPVSSKSMVAVAHGFGVVLANKTFDLIKYNNY
ncbi:MAG: hypothetical protein IJJ76_04805 [Ruminococcus sp.]|uniref:hypothetical protein n=1 Tax=Ruminococcus sp. TaxID=41978 RepID=UPI0025D4B8CA|nr:hypothetical protein [Ruminococcus sp.]MBR0529068.1 hypothetical protein [Ruminococcus sp.]